MTPNLPNPCDTPDNPDSEATQTLSSHQSQTKKSSSSRWLMILGLVLLIVGIGGGGKWWLAGRAAKNGMPQGALAGKPQAVPVKLETLKNGILEDSTAVVGTLEAPRSLMLKSEVEGRVSQILVQEGARVKAGQVIFWLESDDLQAELFQSKARLENAKARLAQLKTGNRPEDIAEAQAQLNQAQARLSNARAGARPEEIAQAQAQLESAKAEAELAKDRVKRYTNLQKEGAISQDLLDELIQKERTTQSTVTEAERRLAQLSKGRQSDLDELGAEVEQARQNLKKLQNGARIEEIAQAEADVAEAVAAVRSIEVKIKKTRITAPFGGIIGDIPIKLGDYIDSGDQVTTITENNVLEVNLSIPVDKAPNLRLGLPVAILDAQGKTETTGEISFISPDITANSQLILAKASLQNGSGNLFNRQFVQAKVIWNKRPGILVPAAAISRVGGQNFVFVAESVSPATADKPQLIAKQKLIKLGSLQGNDYQVLEGLKAGDQIVTAGILNLRDESPIQALNEEKGMGNKK